MSTKYLIKLAENINSLAHYAKGTLISLKITRDFLHNILGSFYTKEVLFHLSLTGTSSLSVIKDF
jgi:hypothetical protein